MSEVIYLYGFVPADTPVPPEVEGVADRAVEVLELGPFAAAISRVPEEEFAPEAVRPKLSELEWVSDQGLRHEGVVNRFVDRGTILPARLLTLYSSAEALAEEASAHGARIERELERLDGCREWDVKISYDADRLRGHLAGLSEEVGALDVQISEASPGTRYLLERKRARIVSEETAKAARRLAGEFLDRLRERALESRLLEAPAEAERLPVVLYAALLVERGREEALRVEAARESRRMEGMGMQVSFSGPWAPYRFLEGMDDDGRPGSALG